MVGHSQEPHATLAVEIYSSISVPSTATTSTHRYLHAISPLTIWGTLGRSHSWIVWSRMTLIDDREFSVDILVVHDTASRARSTDLNRSTVMPSGLMVYIGRCYFDEWILPQKDNGCQDKPGSLRETETSGLTNSTGPSTVVRAASLTRI